MKPLHFTLELSPAGIRNVVEEFSEFFHNAGKDVRLFQIEDEGWGGAMSAHGTKPTYSPWQS